MKPRLSRQLLLTLLIVFCCHQQGFAGNAWMMEKSGRELIMLNAKLLEHLQSEIRDGKITLSGDVVHRDGRVIIKLHTLEQTTYSNRKKIFHAETLEGQLPYHIFLREEELSEIPEIEKPKIMK